MQIRILSVPSGHVYVRHLSDNHGVDHDDVVRLPDPPVGGDVPAAQWWPPRALDADWVWANLHRFDLFHLHFGFDARSPAQLCELVNVLRTAGKPLVYTVHDLRNPHHEEPELHDEQLDVLVPAADAVLTLTPGAAREINRRWHREALVIPHPHVVDEPMLSRPRREGDGFVIGVHLKSLRASMDPLPVVERLAESVRDLPDARLRVDVHTDVMTPGFARHDPVIAARVSELAADDALDLRVHDFFADDELWAYLQGLDVSVLPYRFGTHSGWLEACHDLGTTVLTSDCGYYHEQAPCLRYHLDPDGLDAESLDAGLLEAYRRRPSWRASPAHRRAQRSEIAAVHRDLYRTLVRA